MKKYYDLLKMMPLFRSATDEDIDHVLLCLEAVEKTYEKNEVIYNYFEPVSRAGIVLEGEVFVVMHNAAGWEHGVRRFTKGGLFGEAYACIPDEPSTVQVFAHIESRILFLRFSNLFEPYATSCPHAALITANLLRETAKSNIFQNQKLVIMTQKYLRDKIMTYLMTLPQDENHTVSLPFDRQNLANYLGVERSALSRELSRMKVVPNLKGKEMTSSASVAALMIGGGFY